MNSTKNHENQSAGGRTAACIRLWRLFSSVKLAVILILIFTSLSLLGTFSSPEFFHSWWVITPGVLLMLNILICSINRWNSIKAALHGRQVKQPWSFFSNAVNTKIMDLHQSPVEVSPVLERALHKQGFRVRSENSEERVYLAADKNRYFKLGTYVSHLSLILFVIAYLIGNSFGFRDTNFLVVEGEMREVGYNTGLALCLIAFEDAYYPDNTPRDYRSQVILYKKGQEVDQALIQVNKPLIYQGTRFYQSFFGPAIQIQLIRNGSHIFTGSVALADVSQNQGYRRNIGYLDLPESGLTLRFVSSATNLPDPMIPKGQLGIDIHQKGQQTGLSLLEKTTPVEIGGIEFTYQEDSQFSGFQVSRDPGNLLVWIAFILFIFGISLVLYFVHRQMWILIQTLSAGECRMFIRLIIPRGFSQTTELNRMTALIEKELQEDHLTKKRGGRHG